MDQNSKDIFKIIKQIKEEDLYMQTEKFMKVNGKMMQQKVMEYTHIQVKLFYNTKINKKYKNKH